MLQNHKYFLHFIAFFLMSLSSIVILQMGVVGNTQMMIWGLMILQLSWGILILKPRSLKVGQWKYALLVLCVVQIGQYGLNEHNFGHGVFNILDVIRYFVFIALVEEIWFRGILQDYLGRNSFKAIIIASVIFGLYHLPHGWPIVLTTTAVGLLYSFARGYGAGILSLAFVHGLMNWLNLSFYPAQNLRVEYTDFLIAFPAICMIGVAGLYLFARNRQSLSR
ncbi:CPBP family intramembrane glutamic endopeptidase [Curvivirga aplysinae]|uniref:CPBP family intramembrane glutamic endopeptidase n=1 Tax=Curvivirga aplysinae TaxID=2529852 RepID=UPI0012BC735B|nr:CPBP family intramembrane glutamic endopeptidase [Curvivirga aplysinae]MTI10407.1 CPBP family intramembrane metalloprotease [Curvivirga aplysinae]